MSIFSDLGNTISHGTPWGSAAWRRLGMQDEIFHLYLHVFSACNQKRHTALFRSFVSMFDELSWPSSSMLDQATAATAAF